jgi:hypothetical protein
MYVLSLNSNTQKQNITCSRHDRAEQISIAHLALSNDHSFAILQNVRINC